MILMPRAKGLAETILDLVFPRGCGACDAPLYEPGIVLCDDCSAGLAATVAAGYCGCCGEDLGPYLLRDGRCTECQAKRPGYERLFRVGRYRSVLRDLILRFKSGYMPILDAHLGDMMADVAAGAAELEDVSLLVPVPSPRRRTWQRKYQPSRLLADRIAERMRRPRVDALRLTRSIKPQKRLHADERAANVRGAFRVRHADEIAGQIVCVVDDVFTTGATMREAARVLRRGGAARVYGLVLATSGSGQAAAAL